MKCGKENESTVKQRVMVLRHIVFVQFICVATDVLETTHKYYNAQVH